MLVEESEMNLSLSREDGTPVMSLSERRDMALQVTVTNRKGEDSHDVRLVASFPPALRYSCSHSPRAMVRRPSATATITG